MENNHKKRKVMLIAAFAVAVIALAGIGYATVVGYKGTAVISDNTATGKVILVEDHAGTYQHTFGTADNLKINTYTDITYNDSTALYTIEGADTPIDTNIVGMKLGQTLTLDISGDITANYSLTVKLVGDLEATAGWTYYIKIDSAYVAFSGDTATVPITGKSTSGTSQTVTAELYIASNTFESFSSKAIGDTTLAGYSGYATAEGSPIEDGKFFDSLVVVFTFTTQ